MNITDTTYIQNGRTYHLVIADLGPVPESDADEIDFSDIKTTGFSSRGGVRAVRPEEPEEGTMAAAIFAVCRKIPVARFLTKEGQAFCIQKSQELLGAAPATARRQVAEYKAQLIYDDFHANKA